MKKGFTLIETIVVIAILGAVSVLIGTNFFGLIGSADEYEKENLYKYLNEAACVYVDSKDFKENRDDAYNDCQDGCDDLKSEWLVQDGYIDDQAYLLNEEVTNNIDKYIIKVTRINAEKKCCVKSYNGTSVSGEGAC